MKKLRFLMTFFVLLAWGGHASADNVVTTNEPYIVPGGTTELVVSLESDPDFVTYAYNFYLFLPEGIEVEQTALGTYVYELKPRNAHHNSNVGKKISNGSIMFGIDHPDIPLTGYQGEVLGITLKASPTLATGTYTGYIRNSHFATNTGINGKNPPDMSFSIVVGDRVILDENSTEAPEAADGVNVLVKRTIAANEWGTICLPFAMSNEQVTAAFGDDVKLCDFTGCDVTENGDGDVTAIKVKFSPVSPLAIEANHPYLIKVSSPVTEFTADNVDIVPEEAPSVDRDKKRIGSKWFYNSFVGTYVANTTLEEFYLFLSGGNFYYSKGLTKMKAFRAYFDFYDVLTSVVDGSAGAKIGLVINDGETTSLNEELRMKSEEFGEGWYSIDGMKLNGEPKKKGIYIKDGRKVVVK